jgi:hypothetical protein
MKNTLKIIGIVALVAVAGFSMAACGGGGGGSIGDSAKSITITDITGKTGEALIGILADWSSSDITAVEFKNISGNSVTVNLLTSSASPWTGSGSYYIMVIFNASEPTETTYVYTNGTASLQKYNISSANSTIAFSKFKNTDDL